MALKRRFTEEERYGLSADEIREGEKYLRKHKTRGAIPKPASLKLYELYMIGCSFHDIHEQYPQYPVPQIILTAALGRWAKDRDRLMSTLKERVQARVVRSVIEQVDFLTTMLSVASAEHMEKMREYVKDPKSNQPPKLRPKTIREYKEVVETLYKIVSGAVPAGNGSNSKSKTSALFNTLEPRSDRHLKERQAPNDKAHKPLDDDDIAAIIAAEIVEDK